MKFCGWIAVGSRKKRVSFGGDLHHIPDPAYGLIGILGRCFTLVRDIHSTEWLSSSV